jgi:hypothetical protein
VQTDLNDRARLGSAAFVIRYHYLPSGSGASASSAGSSSPRRFRTARRPNNSTATTPPAKSRPSPAPIGPASISPGRPLRRLIVDIAPKSTATSRSPRLIWDQDYCDDGTAITPPRFPNNSREPIASRSLHPRMVNRSPSHVPETHTGQQVLQEPSKPAPGPATRGEPVTDSENGVRGEEIFFSTTPLAGESIEAACIAPYTSVSETTRRLPTASA